MAMNAGSATVKVNDDGTIVATGAGLALAIANAMLATPAFKAKVAALRDGGGKVDGLTPQQVFVKYAAICFTPDGEQTSNAVAAAVIAHLQTSALVDLSTGRIT